MYTNEERPRLGADDSRFEVSRPGLLTKILTATAGAVMLVGAFMISLVALAAIAAVGLVAGLYLWWRTRELRRRMREQMRQRPPGGQIIEGEVIPDDTTPSP